MEINKDRTVIDIGDKLLESHSCPEFLNNQGSTVDQQEKITDFGQCPEEFFIDQCPEEMLSCGQYLDTSQEQKEIIRSSMHWDEFFGNT